ncbi:MAG: hypothetical protein ACXV1K_04945 [Kineosporiaceae bacterium]
MRLVPRTLARSAVVTVVAGALAAAPAAALHRPTSGHRGGLVAAGGGERHEGRPAFGGRREAPPPATPGVPTGATAGATTAPQAAAPRIGTDDGRRDLRWWPYGNVLHGAFAVETKEHGVTQLVAQRGLVTDATDSSITVTSSDGFAFTWTLTGATRLVAVPPRRGVPRVLAKGCVVGVWGPGTDAGATASFVIVGRAGRGGPGDGSGDGSEPTPTAGPTPTTSPTPSTSPPDGTPGTGPTDSPTSTG